MEFFFSLPSVFFYSSRSCELKLIEEHGKDLPTLWMRHSWDFIACISCGPIWAKRVNWLDQLIPTSSLDAISSWSYIRIYVWCISVAKRSVIDGPGKPGTCFRRCTYIFIIFFRPFLFFGFYFFTFARKVSLNPLVNWIKRGRAALRRIEIASHRNRKLASVLYMGGEMCLLMRLFNRVFVHFSDVFSIWNM